MASTPLINKDTPVARGLRSGINAIGGFFAGLVVVVWNVPGVPEAINKYLNDNTVGLLLALGVGTGLAGLAAGGIAWLWNTIRRNQGVKTVK